ncbi:hypothetical protein BABINDRAFT_10308 [Babjeviella inositovora NRRL Y-12698]|uniref:Major facilitator superfamily (MFS) profile domain-containing protein n=1 Tax=Babjeviella inositovora NRRL Y-12698 TaxID=984486 RepID=A0A1E3QI91_9ASCO|nr:uncharacterized protein BABINDRAFT_10308 [Babjeviella inositovora NRRL Y-12698]ODQ77154.1 hypothetical protein BABINDRAFT_10308 [Babjeviella inositovora NRRL Y-12698]
MDSRDPLTTDDPPRKRWFGLKYTTFLVCGIALLWPWNCFLSASAYYGERFKAHAFLSANYSSTMMTVSTITSMVGNVVLARRQTKDYALRLVRGQVLAIIVFFVMAFTCVAFLHVSPFFFFPFLMVMVFVSSVATCVAQNGCMALVNVMGPLYANAVMVGQAVAGVLPSIALILSILLVEKSNKPVAEEPEANWGLFLYFIASCVVSGASIVLFKVSATDSGYANADEANVEEHSSFELDSDESPGISRLIPLMFLWYRLKYIVLSILLTFCVTLAFPVFASTVESVRADSAWRVFSKQIFIPMAYLVWNMGDLAGRVACVLPVFCVKAPAMLMAYSLARLAFIPLLFMCNVKNRGAWVHSDLFYMALQFLFGFSNGQLSSLCFMSVGTYFQNDDEKAAAGGFSTIFLSAGLATGSLLSYVIVYLIH